MFRESGPAIHQAFEALGLAPTSQSRLLKKAHWTFLSSLGESGFFSSLLKPPDGEKRTFAYQSIGWTDLSVTNFVTSSSKKECWLTSNSLRDTFAFTSPMAFPFKKSTDLMET